MQHFLLQARSCFLAALMSQKGSGKLIGNRSQVAKGLKKQVEGKAEKALGDVKEGFKGAREALKDAGKKH